MKTNSIFIFFLILFIGTPAIFAQGKKEKQEKEKEKKEKIVREQITSKQYKIDITTALPHQGPAISLTPRYSIEIKNDSLISFLPYYGRAYSIPYGGGNGLHFIAPLKEYTMRTDKKGNASIQFSARTIEDLYEFNIKVFPNGAVSVNVNMQNRQSIGFTGNLVE